MTKISAREVAEAALFPYILLRVAEDSLDDTPESKHIINYLNKDMQEYRSLLTSLQKISIFESTIMPARLAFIHHFLDRRDNKVHTIKLLASAFALIDHLSNEGKIPVTDRLATAVNMLSDKMEEQHLDLWHATQKSAEKAMNKAFADLQKRGLYL